MFSSHASIFDLMLFYGIFSALVVVLFPLGVIDLAAGFLFGLWVGYPVALATKTSGSVLCFLISRHTCRSKKGVQRQRDNTRVSFDKSGLELDLVVPLVDTLNLFIRITTVARRQ